MVRRVPALLGDGRQLSNAGMLIGTYALLAGESIEHVAVRTLSGVKTGAKHTDEVPSLAGLAGTSFCRVLSSALWR